MARRDAAFLEKVDRAIFANPVSPYRALLRSAGCEPGDVRRLVEEAGVEGTLERLRDAGVYVTFDEFKGRAPVRRGSQSFTFRDGDFDNPLARAHYHGTTGGTRGAPRRIIIDLEHLAQMAPHWALWFLAHDVASVPLVFVSPSYPSVVNHHLMSVKLGIRYAKWFCTGGGGTWPYRLAAMYLQGLVRAMTGLPAPERVRADDGATIGRYLTTLTARGARVAVHGSPSMAVRIAAATRDRGEALEGVTFLLGGEPLTPARRRTIEATGARATVTYGFSEGGNIGSQCASPVAADDVHVCSDAYAVIPRTRGGAGDGRADVLLFTALRPACPKVLLNTDIGDTAVLERRTCDCLFDDLGYRLHLHTVRSSHKLTGEGVTFAGADVGRILEEILPRRFGGTVADYQLVEDQTPEGLPRYRLRVSPDVGPLDEAALVRTFLDALAGLQRPYGFMVEQWRTSAAVQVERGRPLPTSRGKVLPFLGLATGRPS
jgi:hypothetical protein